MAAHLRQTSFAAGELSPLLWGRTDLDLHAHAVRTLQNFLVSRQGAAVTRPGTRLLCQAKVADVILVPFIYSDSDSYLLELGAGYMRVLSPSTGVLVVELVTPWLTDLGALQWAQSGGSLYFAHQQAAPQELLAPSALTAGAWLLRPVRFSPPGDTPADLGAISAAFRDSAGGAAVKPVLTSNGTDLFVYDASHLAREWQYRVAALMRHVVTGEVVETLPVAVDHYYETGAGTLASLPSNNLIVLYADRPVTLTHRPGISPPAAVNWEPAGQVYYRGRGGVFGLVGQTDYAQDFVDVGDEPNYQYQPLRGSSPFPVGEYPAAVAFFQQRLCFAGTPSRPATLWASAVDDWANFDALQGPVVREDMPLEVTLAARKRERIRSLVPSQRLVVLTDTSVWTTGGAVGSGFGTSIENHLEDEVGSLPLAPLVVDGAVLYVRTKGRGVRALTVADGGQLQASDASWHAEHLWREYLAPVSSWCFARDPWEVAWVVRQDGALLSCTRTGAATWAWAKHLTGPDDRVRSVAALPRTRADIVYLAVERVGGTFIEWMMERDRTTDIYLSASPTGDSTYALDSHKFTTGLVATPITVTGLDHLEGRDVWAVAVGNAPQGPFRVTGGAITTGAFPQENLTAGGNHVTVCVGLPFTCDLELLDAAPGRLNQKTVVRVGLEVDSAQGLEAGEDFDHLVPWRQRAVSDSYEYPSAASALIVIDVKGAWRRTGRAVLRQAKPLPVTVLGVTREVDGGS